MTQQTTEETSFQRAAHTAARWLPLFLLLALAPRLSAQTVSVYDDFSGSALDAHRWEIATEEGAGRATPSVQDGVLTITGAPDRAGIASRMRLGTKGAVEVDALGYTGTNQILQLYGGVGDFTNDVEFGIEGTTPDGKPLLHVWAYTGEAFAGASPDPVAPSPTHPLHMRIERNGQDYCFLANGTTVYTLTSAAIPGEARIFLYGFGPSVSKWDNVRVSGAPADVLSPRPGGRVTTGQEITASAGAVTAAWRLEAGEGAYPSSWKVLASGIGPSDAIHARWNPGPNLSGPAAFRLRTTDAAGNSRAFWSVASLERAALWEPLEGSLVGPAFTAAVGGPTDGIVRARFYDNGVLAAQSTTAPFWGRIIPKVNGPHTITAVLVSKAGATTKLPPVHVTVRRQLYGNNARVADYGRACRFPDGSVTVAIGENDSYTWEGLRDLWADNKPDATESYIRMLRTRGVNVMRVMLEGIVPPPEDLLEKPLGSFRPSVVKFWDTYLKMCERHGMTVLITPWDTFWMNQPWTASPYNKANGGPCATPHDFIVNPEARKVEKNRLKFMIDRWGNSPAIFAIDLLNEFDIWWDATPTERRAWVEDMAAFVRSYELKRWGKCHMLTVSAAAAEPGGIIADVTYRYPMFEWANTHLYYWGTVSDPKNIIDPALSMNHGVKYALSQIRDGRPYTDTESGPMNRWVPDDRFDNAVYHYEAWAHFASGGCGPGMRWPYRVPHILTPGMHATQQAIAQVANHVDWAHFNVANADDRLTANPASLIAMGSADADQAVIWLTEDVRKGPAHTVNGASVTLRGAAQGRYDVTFWNAATGFPVAKRRLTPTGRSLVMPLPPFSLDMAITVKRAR